MEYSLLTLLFSCGSFSPQHSQAGSGRAARVAARLPASRSLLMNNKPLSAVAALAALALAACDDGHHHNDNEEYFNPIPPSWAPVSLVSLSDVERELGNLSTTLTVTDVSNS